MYNDEWVATATAGQIFAPSRVKSGYLYPCTMNKEESRGRKKRSSFGQNEWYKYQVNDLEGPDL